MNREIKFRAWDTSKDIMYVNHTLASISETRIGKWESLVWMQFTGQHDKNGTEIYEGDIIQDHNGIGVVEFDKWSAFAVTYRSPERFVGRGKWFCDYIMGERESVEVIGNIYNTPVDA